MTICCCCSATSRKHRRKPRPKAGPPTPFRRILSQARASLPAEDRRFWLDTVKDHITNNFPSHLAEDMINKPAQILPFLWLGSVDQATNVAHLQSVGIKRILNCAPGQCRNHAMRERLYGTSFVYDAIWANDEEYYDLLGEHFDTAFTLIEDARRNEQPILVHCFAGINRSATIVIAYLMAHAKWSLMRAVAHTYSLRPFILQNRSFRVQLVELAFGLRLLSDTGVEDVVDGLYTNTQQFSSAPPTVEHQITIPTTTPTGALHSKLDVL
eukprot:TRINITY_DN39385_c0_g1_i1.p1 TRINITY_DN39385_c0_g1~~TRINITY_DN39385_c0_g1_i1.p1  ORF type:complete len:269 (+),score=6.24 TRINITY_DN39385_c0_g1_i1:98-904(+)